MMMKRREKRTAVRTITRFFIAIAMISSGATVPARAQNDPTVYMITYLDTFPSAAKSAATLLKRLADASRKEAGVLRFDVLQRTVPYSQFLLLEVWKDQQASDAHMAASGTTQMRNKLAPV